MRSFFSRLVYKLNVFMYGRNGMDAFNKFLFVVAIVFSVLSYFRPFYLLSPLSTLVIIYILYRAVSKNLYKRQKENAKFWDIRKKFLKGFNLRKKMWQDRNTHKYFKCKNCKTVLRLPKNRGKIEVICPKCNAKTIHTT